MITSRSCVFVVFVVGSGVWDYAGCIGCGAGTMPACGVWRRGVAACRPDASFARPHSLSQCAVIHIRARILS